MISKKSYCNWTINNPVKLEYLYYGQTNRLSKFQMAELVNRENMYKRTLEAKDLEIERLNATVNDLVSNLDYDEKLAFLYY